MNDFIKTLEDNKKVIVLVLAILMFVLFGFCAAIDILGKDTANGFKIIFNGKGMGFSRVLSIVILVIPILLSVNTFGNLTPTDKARENFNAICFGAGIVLVLFMAVILPKYVTLAWGSWMYIFVAIIGLTVSCLEFIKSKMQ